MIAETNGTAGGTILLVRRCAALASDRAGTTRECIWLIESEISPTFGSRTQVDRPLAVVDGLAGPLLMVHVDHLASFRRQQPLRPEPPGADDQLRESHRM